NPSAYYIYLPSNWSTDSADATIIGWYLNWSTLSSKRIYYGGNYCHSADFRAYLSQTYGWYFYNSGNYNCSQGSSDIYSVVYCSSDGTGNRLINDDNINYAIDLYYEYEAVALVEYGEISAWDVSDVTDMSYVFYNQSNFNENITNWDTSGVTDMEGMFMNATSFNKDIGGGTDINSNSYNSSSIEVQSVSSWDVSNVNTMYRMFKNATSFDQDIGSWDISNVINMQEMFNGVTLSTENYDNILMGWASQNVQYNVVFDAGDSMYCSSSSARDHLINNYGWTIIDGGVVDCSALNTNDESLSGISIYPNPTKDFIYLKGNNNNLRVMIYDITGKIVFKKLVTNTIDISNLNNGMYLLHISMGLETSIIKIIKN
ncbi:MAG: hypothetical protein CMP78_00950, partial [Formosa sp.]|nr:hypothetical protein [Formosa sp.]